MTPARVASPIFRTRIPEIEWPAVSGRTASDLLAISQQYAHSQWWSAERLLQHQLRQLAPLVRFAFENVPLYRGRLAAAGYRRGRELTLEIWRKLRPLERQTARERMGELLGVPSPPEHGEPIAEYTSGKTGIPLKVLRTPLAQLFYGAQTLRHGFWCGRDFRRKLAAIRLVEGAEREQRFANWGHPEATIFTTGPAVRLDWHSSTEEQVAFLLREQPDYLVISAGVLGEVARRFRDRGLRLERLAGISTFGSQVGPQLRPLVREAFGLEISDMYSAAEVGHIALQCPRFRHYHVTAECTLVEVLNEAGEPCAPGETGSVVVTSLHNYGMPLLRYRLGDLAEVGPPCPCGRGLPVLREIVGRERDLIVLPSGERQHVWYGIRKFAEYEQIQQLQIVQKTLCDLEVKLVIRGAFGPVQEEELRQKLAGVFEPGMSIAFAYVDAIPRGPGGKFEDFVSEVKDE
jgi:phenylacetate-CoA ligase